MLAFFDPRHAARAKEILSTPSTGPLADCVNNEPTEDVSRPWIYCDFISAEKLAEVREVGDLIICTHYQT
jgi:hypothetical protein